MFTAMRYSDEGLSLIDQRLLPNSEVWLLCRSVEEVALAIEDMVVRGAPAIGCAAAFGIALDARNHLRQGQVLGQYRADLNLAVARLARTRPTAVNLFFALDRINATAAKLADDLPMAQVAAALSTVARLLFDEDLATCRAIGEHGAAEAGAARRRVVPIAMPVVSRLRATAQHWALFAHCTPGT